MTGYEGTGVESLYPSNTDIFRYAKEQGGIGAYVHPFSGARDPLETTLGTAKSFPVDVALGSLSYHELWSQNAGEAPLMVWYRVLNAGFRVPAVGGEDSISNLHDIELVASVRGYFHLGSQPLTWANWMKAFLAGRGFVSNGPLIEFTANGRMPGEELAVAPGARVQIKAEVTSIAPLDRVDVVRNGEVIHSATVSPDRRRASIDLPVTVETSGWYSVRAIGPDRTFPVENTRPQAVTNPVYVIAGGRPIRDRASAEYFVKWIDRLTAMATAHPGWRSDQREGARARPVRRGAGHLPAARGRSSEVIARITPMDSSADCPDGLIRRLRRWTHPQITLITQISLDQEFVRILTNQGAGGRRPGLRRELVSV